MNDKSNDSTRTIQQNNASQRAPAKNLVDAISEIQIMNVAECSGADIAPNYFTWQMSIEFFAVGFKSFVAGFILCLFLVPLAVASAHSFLPLYGGEANLYDKIFMFILAFAISFGATAILLSSAKYVRSVTTYQMVKSLYSGALASVIIKGVVLFFIFQVIAALITPSFVVKYLQDILIMVKAYTNIGEVSAVAGNFVAKVKPIFRISAMIMLLFSFVTSIAISYQWIIMRKKYLKYKHVKDYTEKGNAVN